MNAKSTVLSLAAFKLAGRIPPRQTSEDRYAESPALTKRERHVLFLLAQGLNAKEIAQKMGTKEDTVRSQSKSIYSKFGVSNAAAAVAFGILTERIELKVSDIARS